MPIAGAKEDPVILENCYKKLKEYLDAGEAICIFPEGMITHNGEMNEFKAGIEKIVTMTNAPVIPVGLKGVYGSIFSRKHKLRIPRTIFRRITLEIGEKIEPENLNKEFLQSKVKELLKK